MMSPSLRLLAAVLLFAGCAREPKAAQPATLSEAPRTEGLRTAVLAAGCFWCVEAVFEPLEGVSAVVSGYAGGTPETANYEAVGAGTTDHAEAVQITYDPKAISYETLLEVFFATHDPTTKDRQGPDWGRQYRSAIFFASREEETRARAHLEKLDGAFPAKVVTTLEPLQAFYPAEAYHQDFVARHPDHPYVRQWVPPKLSKLRKDFRALLKPEFQK